MGFILLLVLIVLLLGGLPRWGYSRNWGYAPGGSLGLLWWSCSCSCSLSTSPAASEPLVSELLAS
jgi:hypothetical protein